MENKDKKIGVGQKAIIFDSDGMILALRRTKTAPSRPLNWDLPGGELDFGEDLRIGIIREIKEETDLAIENLSLMDAISGLNDQNEFWVIVCYMALFTNSEIKLSYEHDDFKWVTPDEFLELKASPRNKKFVEIFKSLQQK